MKGLWRELGSLNKDLQFVIASKAERQATIHASLCEDDKSIAAAIEIQRVWRGYSTRCKLFSILHPSAIVMSRVEDSHSRESPLLEVKGSTPSAPHPTPRLDATSATSSFRTDAMIAPHPTPMSEPSDRP